ncbi:MAG TPA: rod shape-determining protein RodA [Limnochordia bacterium]|nr:rod shape-determining protein RodA [Limnochordia bacterium]
MIDFQRRLARSVDLPLLGALALLLIFGLTIVYTATFNLSPSGAPELEAQHPYYWVSHQAVWAVLGIAALAAAAFFDYRVYSRYSRIVYIGMLLLLVVVLIVGPERLGARRWIDFGPIQLQPAEFAKIGLILTLAQLLDKRPEPRQLRALVLPFLHTAVPMLLILKEPDLGTTMVFVSILFGMLFVAGASRRHLLAIALSGALLFAAAIWASLAGVIHVLKDYQLQRLVVFLDPGAYRNGAGWNIIQSKIAIGSGGFFGNGLLAGSQTQLDFLPERHTDFIFAVIGEEFGFVGAIALLGLYALVLWRVALVVRSARDRLGALITGGVFAMLLTHIFVNVGMAMGIMPVTGIPLPFVSVGGSFLLSNLLAVGLVVGVQVRHKRIVF